MNIYEIGNLDRYKVFYLAVKLSSISKAAVELGISQPAVTKTLRKLEEELGTSLLVRTPRGVSPTENGRMLYKELNIAFDHILHAYEKLTIASPIMETATVYIGIDSLLSQYYLTPLLNRFSKEHPGIFPIINKQNPQYLESSLLEGSLDLAVFCVPIDPKQKRRTMYVQSQHRNIVKYSLSKLTDIFIAGSKYACFSEKPASISQLAEIPFIYPTNEVYSSDYYSHILRQDGPLPGIDIPISGADSRLFLAQHNRGFTYFPRELLKDELKSGTLIQINTAIRMRKYDFFILISSERRPSFAAMAVISMLINNKV